MCPENHYGDAEWWNNFLLEVALCLRERMGYVAILGGGTWSSALSLERQRMGPRVNMIYSVRCWERCPDPHLRRQPLHSLYALCRRSVFWDKILRWVNSCLLSTPASNFSHDDCIPPLFSFLPYLRRSSTFQICCSMPEGKTVSAHLSLHFPAYLWQPTT